jgi:NADH-quinone oxidoreductase subunit M
MLWMFQRVNYGPVTNAKNRGLRDLSPREWLVIAPVCAVAIFMGVVPGVFLKPMEPAVRKTLQQVVGTNAPINAKVPAPSLRPAATDTEATVSPEIQGQPVGRNLGEGGRPEAPAVLGGGVK